MNQVRVHRPLAPLLALLVLIPCGHSPGQEAASSGRDLPPAFAPLEFLVGRWNGQGIPRDNPALRFRGWTETHTWAWAFAKGQPVGLSLEIQGGKLLASGTLRFDARESIYRFETKESGDRGRPVVYTGRLDGTGKRLVLETRGGTTTERLTIRANSNYVRYTMTAERREPGATAFTPRIEVGLTREGESLGAGSSSSERPRCIVTGGAATLTVSYRGQNYPICCTGCRDEFNENPEKYLKKLSLRAPAEGESKGQPKPASKVSRFEDAFAGDVAEGGSTEPSAMKPASRKPQGSSTRDAGSDEPAKPATAGKSSTAARAATALRLAQNLEKSGKNEAALKAYRQVVKDHPRTVQAKTAAARIKALEGR